MSERNKVAIRQERCQHTKNARDCAMAFLNNSTCQQTRCHEHERSAREYALSFFHKSTRQQKRFHHAQSTRRLPFSNESTYQERCQYGQSQVSPSSVVNNSSRQHERCQYPQTSRDSSLSFAHNNSTQQHRLCQHPQTAQYSPVVDTSGEHFHWQQETTLHGFPPDCGDLLTSTPSIQHIEVNLASKPSGLPSYRDALKCKTLSPPSYEEVLGQITF